MRRVLGMLGLLALASVSTAVHAAPYDPIFHQGFEPQPANCAPPGHFADGRVPSRYLHVAPWGSNASGDGSAQNPYATLVRAAQEASPGTAIVLRAGSYSGGQFIANLRGTAAAPIWIGGAAGEPTPVISGGANAIQFSRPAYLVLHDLQIRSASANGINIDDGGEVGNPLAAHHVAIERLDIRNIGSTGNQDCLKISGVSDLWIRHSHFQDCGAGGSGIDFVGSHRGLVYANRLLSLGASGVQAKGGSTDIDILANRFENAGGRAVNMGGSTSFEFFRPPLSTIMPNAEARRIRALSNLFIGSAQAPLNFVGCVDCVAAHNTVLNPGSWLVRMLQETISTGPFVFEPTRNTRLQNNLFLFQRSSIGSSAVNVGANTDAASSVWLNNLFFASDQPAQSNPNAPGSVSGSILAQDPLIVAPDYRISAASPAAGAGSLLEVGLPDLGSGCFALPPSIGAWELP